MSWYRPTLEKVGHVAFIMMCIAVTAVGVQRLLAARANPSVSAAPSPFPAGTRLALHPTLAPGPSRASVVVALSTTCQYCTASMPFYRRLAEHPAAKDGRLRLGVVGLQPEAQIREYMAGYGLAIPTVVDIREAGVPLQATPTLLLMDGKGAITRSFAGRLRPDEETAVIKEISRLTSQ